MLRSIYFKLTVCMTVAILAGQVATVLYLVYFVWRPDPNELQDRFRWFSTYIERDAQIVSFRVNQGESLRVAARTLITAPVPGTGRQGGQRRRERLIVDEAGRVVLSTLPITIDELPSDEQALLQEALRSYPRATSRLMDESRSVVAVPIGANRKTVGVLFARRESRSTWEIIRGSWSIRDSVLAGVALRLGTAVLIAVLFSMVLSFLLTGSLHEITKVAAAISQGDLSRRLPVRSRDEIGRLANEFNNMTEKLQQTIGALESERDKLIVALEQLRSSEDRRRQLVADASHELRTPIACMQGTIEALQDEVITDPDGRREALNSVHEDILRLTLLVEDLLTQARAEQGELRLDRQPIEVNDLVNRAAARFKPRADSMGVNLLTPDPVSALLIAADEHRLTQVMDNLIENALHHTPEGGEIRLTTGRNNGHVAICVEDTGHGIPDEDLPFVFERFYRSDRSRSRSTGGTGLGLAIVREIIEAHSGHVGIESTVGEGTRVTVELPMLNDLESCSPQPESRVLKEVII